MSAERLRALLFLGAAGAVVVVLRFLPALAELGGTIAIVIATLLTAPAPADPSAQLRWWRLLALGAVLAAVGLPVSLVLETIGGMIAGAGGALTIVGACFGWPAPGRAGEASPS